MTPSILLSVILLATPLTSNGPTHEATPLVANVPPLEQPLRLALRAHPEQRAEPTPRFDLRDDLRLPAAAPEGLRLDLHPHRKLTLYLSANLDPAILPRLDAIDGEAYFSVGAELAVRPDWTLFVESFQSSAAVLGRDADPFDPVVDMSWDGAQVSAGLRWALHPRVSLDAAPVFYVLSESGRAASVGFRGGLALHV